MSGVAIPMQVTAAKATFEANDQAVQAYRQEFSDIIEEYERLTSQRDESFEDYKKQVQSHHSKLGRHFGNFTITIPRMVNSEKFVELFGEKKAIAKGYVSIEYKLNRKKYDSDALSGNIDAKIVKAVEFDGSVRVTLR